MASTSLHPRSRRRSSTIHTLLAAILAAAALFSTQHSVKLVSGQGLDVPRDVLGSGSQATAGELLVCARARRSIQG
jgi:hypothetical protein